VFALVSVNLLLSGLSNLQGAALAAAIIESLPRSVRGRTFGLVYALPVTVLGGTTQLFVTWLLKVTGTPMSLAWYLTAVQVVGLLAILALPESSPNKRHVTTLNPAPA
jgi:hypothetical protein